MTLPLALSLVPYPSSASVDEGRVAFTPATRIVSDGESDAAAALLADALAERTGIRPAITAEAPAPGDIVLRVGAGDVEEGYTLRVDDRIELDGSDAAGLFYAAQTLRQLLSSDGSGWGVPRARIEDAPRFDYRGVMLDVARTFFGVDVVKAFIDRASSLKFNRLHLHLSDDQGWRLHIDSRPLLTERASTTSALGRPGGFYTPDDYREIVAYAAARHMVVVPEIDLPGHTHAIGVAYPELVEAPVLTDDHRRQSAQLGQPLPVAGEPYQGWAVGHSSVRIHDEATYEFLRDVLTEVAELTPGPYMHIGGDEALGTPPADFAVFVERVSALTSALGKTPIAWHEAGAADVAPGTIGQYWGSTVPQGSHAEEARHFVERGGALILSPSNVAYLDMKYDADFPLGISWAGLIDVRTAYEWEPAGIVDGVAEESILGVEAPLWAETLRDLADIDQLLLPRAAAVAEVAWSPAAGAQRTWQSFRERVATLGPAWDAAGWGGHRTAEIPWSSR